MDESDSSKDEFTQDCPDPLAVKPPLLQKGRGAASNSEGRFDSFRYSAIDDGWGILEEDLPPVKTTVTVDRAQSIITRNDSPDVPFEQSINPYRGCEHGCIYCFARPTHAYLGLSPGLDFESRLFAKPDAARLLAGELSKPGYRCKVVAMGTNTDPYQPSERTRHITRDIIEVLAAHRHPLSIVTKSALIERDIEILSALAKDRLVSVFISVTTLDRELSRRMEPRASSPQRRLSTIRMLSAAGIPTGILAAPMIPALNDHELEKILEVSAEAGADSAGYLLLRLPWEVKDLFKEWLMLNLPTKAAHVLSMIRSMRQDKENDPRFGSRMRGTGHYADILARRFELACRRLHLNESELVLDTSLFRVPVKSGMQLNLL